MGLENSLAKIDFKKLTRIRMKKIERETIIHYFEVRDFCSCPYPNHPKGRNAGFKPGIVLDIFTGIGTTLLEAWRLGRNFIGFDLSKEYCEIAEKPLSKTRYKRLDDFISSEEMGVRCK